MSRKKGSLYTKEYLEGIVSKSTSVADALRHIGRHGGGMHRQLKQYLHLYQIDTSHFDPMSARVNALKESHAKKASTDSLLVENSSFSRTHLKDRLYREGLKTRLCEICGQGEDWHGKHMSLILDHINGVYNDNRLENLRIVCPNCNATLDTHGGKNQEKKEKSVKVKSSYRTPTKIQWPDNETLRNLVWSKPMKNLATELGVTDTSIRIHCKKNSIDMPPPFYWVRKSWLDT